VTDYLNPQRPAKRWGCKPAVVISHIKAGRLRAFSLSPPGTRRPHWRIPIEAVTEFEAANQARPALPKPTRRRRQTAGVIQFY